MHACQFSSSIPVRLTENCSRQRKAGAVPCVFVLSSSKGCRKYLLFKLFLFETVSHFPVFPLPLTKMPLTKFGNVAVMQRRLQHEKIFFPPVTFD